MQKIRAIILAVIIVVCSIDVVLANASENVDAEKIVENLEDKESGEKEEEIVSESTTDDETLADEGTDAESEGEKEQENKDGKEAGSEEKSDTKEDIKEEARTEGTVEKTESEEETESEVKTGRERSSELSKKNEEKDHIYHVSFPTDSKAYLDPENLSGKGQIFSDEFEVENYGNTDIAIKIKNIEVNYRTTKEVYEFTENKVIDNRSHIKKLNVDIVWKNEKEHIEKILHVVEGDSNEYVLFLKASEYDEDGNFDRFNEGSVGAFYFTGTLNSNPEIEWENGEITVSFGYEIVEIEEAELADEFEITEEEN